MIYSIHEDSERLRNIDLRAGNNASWKKEDGKNNKDRRDKQRAYNSGNTMESLAKTNPELFNNTKLKALQASENLVKDFNEYMASVYGNDIDRFGKFVESIKRERDNRKIENQFKMEFNQSFHLALFERYKDLMMRGVSEKEAARIVSSEYFPESLDEEGIRKAINLRIANNRCLTDNLTTMIRQNYALFNLSKAEADALIQDLGSDDKNGEAIGQIKQFLQNPKLLEKFKMGNNNYDFRPIGGAVLIMSDDNDIKFSEHPSKNLAWIFKYDAIVSSHGGYAKESIMYNQRTGKYRSAKFNAANTSAKDIHAWSKKQNIALRTIKQSFAAMKKDIQNNEVEIGDKAKFLSVYYKFDDLMADFDEFTPSERSAILKDVRVQMDVYRRSESVDKHVSPQRIVQDMNLCSKIAQTQFSNDDPKQAIDDGESANWIMQPVSTLSSSNLNRVVDVIRALKDEGFKNILISSCNTGGVELPKDLRNSKDFKVTYATSSILKEEYVDPEFEELDLLAEQLDLISIELNSPYRNMSINELYTEYDLLCTQYPINEGIIDKLKEFAKKAWQIIVELWKRLINLIKTIIQKMREFFIKTFSKKSKIKFQNPIEVSCITLSGDKADIIRISARTPFDIEKAFSNSNKSLEYAIQYHAKREMQYMKQYNERLNMNDLLDKMQGIRREFTIFESVVLI